MPVKLCGICTVLHSPAQGPAQAGAPGARIRRQLGWFRFQTLRVPGHSAFNACAKCSLLRRLQVRRSDLFDIIATGNRPWDRSGTRALRASVPSTWARKPKCPARGGPTRRGIEAIWQIRSMWGKGVRTLFRKRVLTPLPQGMQLLLPGTARVVHVLEHSNGNFPVGAAFGRERTKEELTGLPRPATDPDAGARRRHSYGCSPLPGPAGARGAAR